jgi:uncharacterized protein (TIGR02145 family)
MKQFYLLVTLILVFNSQHATAQNDSIYFWKGGVLDLKKSIKTADLDSITFKRPVANIPKVTIGTQTWTTKNLDVTTYSDGTVIPQVTDPTAWANLTTGAWCYYNNDSATGTTYGKLYNWYAVAGIHDTDPNTPNKKLAPTGYHIPSDAEWTTLTTYLGGESIAGGKMKATGISLWNTPNTGATNSSGFTGLPGGYRDNNDSFDDIGNFGTWWSSSEDNTTYAWYRFLNYFNGRAYRGYNYKNFGFSVRCLAGETAVLAVVPTVITSTVTSIATTSASCGGSITADGGASVMARGVVWSTTTNPTIDLSTKTEDGIEIGTYTSALSGLVANTTYYVRAYATNRAGTGYGAEVSFATLPPPTEVVIDTQTWTTKNLDVATYSDGTLIPEVQDPTAWANLTTGAWCYYNNDSATGTTYGKLYNWYAVAGIHDTDPNTPNKKLAPTGYQIPSDAEWTTLSDYLGGQSVAGGKMKATGTSLWKTPNTEATNNSGFTGLPGGCRDYDGTFYLVGSFGFWWSSAEDNTTDAWYRYLIYDNGTAYSTYFYLKPSGFSVRCLRD